MISGNDEDGYGYNQLDDGEYLCDALNKRDVEKITIINSGFMSV